MADQPNDRDPLSDKIGDEMDKLNREKRQQGTTRPPPNTQSEPTDTLEDRNLSGASTWATLPDQNQSEEEDESESDRDSENR
jgi:hypothetical protein